MESEVLISVDCEANGPIPSRYSLQSIGACVIGDTKERFYVELKPLNESFTSGAVKVSGMTNEQLKERGTEPGEAVREFEDWVTEVARRRNARPVFASFGTFDWMFVKWYLGAFGKYPKLFGPNGLDMKSYFMGALGTSWSGTRKRELLPRLDIKGVRHTHNALDDAVEQAIIFEEGREAHTRWQAWRR